MTNTRARKMNTIGTVESLWRYPVKSMRGEELEEIFAGFAGVYCDRLFAFHSSASQPGLPYLTAREQRRMLSFQPRFLQPEKAATPPNLKEAEKLASGATPLYADRADLMLTVETPAGETLSIDDPELIERLREGIDEQHQLTLLRSERALTDCRPVSLIALQSIKQLAAESGSALDKRRFRANIYLDLTNGQGFTEDNFVGRSLRIGPKSTLAIVQRDSRCMVITLDPETGEQTPAVLKTVAQDHGGTIGIYAAVLVEGMIRKGDAVELLD
jgi:uncharacterized protein